MEQGKNNAAYRVRNLLVAAKNSQDSLKTVDVWKMALANSNDPVESFEVIRLIELLRSELRSIERILAKQGVPKQTYSPHFQSAYQATAVENVNATWSNFRGNITNELLVCLQFSEFIIKEDEPEFAVEQIEKITQLIQELRSSLEDPDLDPELTYFVSQQISLLERGLRDLKIRGSKAIQKCYVDGLGEILEHSDILQDNADTPIVNKLKAAWGHVQSATEKAAQLNKSVDTWGRLLERGADVVDQFAQLA